MKKSAEGVQKLWNKYKYAMLIGMLGVGILLTSGNAGQRKEIVSTEQRLTDSSEVDPTVLQKQLEEILGTISGVGEVRVLLTLDSDGEVQLAQDSRLEYRGQTEAPEDYSRTFETVLVDAGSGEETVVTMRRHPTYRGALIVCQGGGRADVQLAVTQAVSVLTGLSSDRIAVAKWQ